MTSRDFIEGELLPSGFDSAVFQLSVGLWPQEYLPELLGMTLFLEWEATPTLTPTVRMLEGRRIDPHFYRLHVAIDNIASGHGALAKQAINLYLEDVREKGGEAAVQQHWQRIWNGYVTWATLGTFGGDLINYLLLFDGKLPDQRKAYAEQRMTALITRKAPAARKSHGSARLGGHLLNELFDDPPTLMTALLTEGWIDPESPRDSRFFRELISFSGPMYKVFTPEDQDVILDWAESQRAVTPPDPPADIGTRMRRLVEQYAGRAGAAAGHDRYRLPEEDGTLHTVREWFNGPSEDLMAALARSSFITPGSVDQSTFFTLVVGPGGLMDGVLPDTDVGVIRDWVAAGCPQPDGQRATPTGEAPAAAQAEGAAEKYLTRAASGFAARRQVIGYGSVH